MSDLDLLATSAIPRPPRIAARIGKKMTPLWGFIAFAILWFIITRHIVFLLPMVAGGMALELGVVAKGGALAVFVSTWLVLEVLVWWLFVSRAKRWRGRAKALIETGLLVEGRVQNGLVNRVVGVLLAVGGVVMRWNNIEFCFEGAHYRARVPFTLRYANGKSMTLLFDPGSKHALSFDDRWPRTREQESLIMDKPTRSAT